MTEPDANAYAAAPIERAGHSEDSAQCAQSAYSAHSAYSGTWPVLLTLTAAFGMSQAFRTVASVLATPLQADMRLSPQQLGAFAGAFHFAFGAMQLVVGIGIDLHGVRRTVLLGFPLSIAGAVVSALAPDYPTLVGGQLLIGIGCAPAFLACTVYIARHFPPHRFSALSGAVLGIGGIGMLATGTPLAWLVEASSWRTGFWVLAAGSAAAWWLMVAKVHEPARPLRHPAAAPAAEGFGQAALSFLALFRLPHTAGILALASVCYASFISLRGLWLGPLLVERHGLTLVQSGNLALAVSTISLLGPSLFGRLDPGDGRRRPWLVGCTLLLAAVFVALAVSRHLAVDIVLALVVGLLSGYMVLQYSDVRVAYPSRIVGRALALFTMAMFLGVAVMQSFTGWVATQAHARGGDIPTAVLLAIAGLLCAGASAYALLPGAPRPPAADSRLPA